MKRKVFGNDDIAGLACLAAFLMTLAPAQIILEATTSGSWTRFAVVAAYATWILAAVFMMPSAKTSMTIWLDRVRGAR